MKSYKSGINIIYDGVELCWGISRYGDRTYTLYYDISNFVTQYTDTQGIYFNMLDLDQEVGNVTIKIYSDILFSLDNSRIWSFGNKGSISFNNNGAILMKSDGRLKDNQYMTLLVRFEENIFNLNNASSKSFDLIYDEAMKEFKELYNELLMLRYNVKELVEMFDFYREILREADEEAVEYMVEEQRKEIEVLKEEREALKEELTRLKKLLAETK